MHDLELKRLLKILQENINLECTFQIIIFVAVNPIHKKGPHARALSNIFVVRLLYSTNFAYVSICSDPPIHYVSIHKQTAQPTHPVLLLT